MRSVLGSPVPAHAGGVDLSSRIIALSAVASVPAHAGGVDLSFEQGEGEDELQNVPAHAGGVDLSTPLSFMC